MDSNKKASLIRETLFSSCLSSNLASARVALGFRHHPSGSWTSGAILGSYFFWTFRAIGFLGDLLGSTARLYGDFFRTTGFCS